MILKNLKDKLRITIGDANYRKLLTTVMRRIDGIDEKILYGNNISHIREYFVPGKDCFFGYYDIQSLNKAGNKLLSLVIKEDLANIGYFDVESGDFYPIADTRAWNWQMGARLRWYEDGKSVLFNDYDGENFISRVVDLQSHELMRFDFPIFDVNFTSSKAYFTDFSILHHLREGYGYSNKKINFEEYYRNTVNGTFSADLNTQEVHTVITLEELQKTEHTDDMENKYHYINHITVNQNQGDIMFFHLWTDAKGTWKNRMVFMDKQDCLINIINDFDRASHYAWQDESHLLASVYKGNQIEYRLYNYRTGNYELMDGMCADGHPAFVTSNCVIADTYPNRYAMQSIYICDMREHTYKNIFSIYHLPEKVGAERCDLHPRVWEKSLINIDAISGQHRCQYIIKTNIATIGSAQWSRTLNLNRNAVIENPGPKHRNLISCINSEYLYTSSRSKSHIIKVLYTFLFDPTFRANVYVNWMQQTAGMFKRRLIHNHLQTKYGMDISEKCKIGIHFRADHLAGIVIGPGVRMGSFCKMYQNVTLGQRHGKFPTIGDHVVIFAGAKILGDVKIGDYAVIGANAVVLNDVPEGAVAVGVPSRIV